MPQFEVFPKRAMPLGTEPLVTIQRRGVLSFNRAAFESLGCPDSVELLYDRAEQIVGLRAAAASSSEAYAVRRAKTKQDSLFMVSGAAFTKYYGISLPSSTRWPGYLEDDVLCVDLKQPGTVVTSNRSNDAFSEESVGVGSDAE